MPSDQPERPQSPDSGTPASDTAPAPVAEEAKREAPKRELPGRDARDASPFSVTVGQVYDGPLDLLLDLVRKQNIDIYDIPIAKITAQFLAYVEHLKASDVDSAGEFIYMSALLIHIKSKMLLPRSPAETTESEAEDPRLELVERLLEHERFRNAAQMLQQKRQLEEATWTNPGIREFRKEAEDGQEIAADTLDLARVFRQVLERAQNRPILDVQEDAVTVRQMIEFVRRRLMMEDRPVALSKLLSHIRTTGAVIAMFLALLELVRLQAILLRQDRSFSEIFIKKHEQFEQAIQDRLSVRDDWS
jgi:segregation and condensation protein A